MAFTRATPHTPRPRAGYSQGTQALVVFLISCQDNEHIPPA